MRHLTESEFVDFHGKQTGLLRRLRKLVIQTWPSPDDWFTAETRTVYLHDTNTNYYWITWGLISGQPIDVSFLNTVKFKNPRDVLKRALACDVNKVERGLLDFPPSFLKNIWSDLLRLLLMTGKNRISDLTFDDIRQAERQHLHTGTRGQSGIEAWDYAHRALHLLGIVKQRAVKRQATKWNEPVPVPMRAVVDVFIETYSTNKSIEKHNFSIKLRSQLRRFFTWWSRNGDGDDLSAMKRSDWLAYIHHIGQQSLAGVTIGPILYHLMQFLLWGWSEDDFQHLMPKPSFSLGRSDYEALVSDTHPRSHRGFDEVAHGDRLIRAILEDTPETPREKMVRAAVIVAATTGARASEIMRTGYRSWAYDSDRKVWKLILCTRDKVGWDWRPILITTEGIDALEEIAKLRDEVGELKKRLDPRTNREYVFLFEYRGRLVAQPDVCVAYMNKLKKRIGLVDDEGRPVKGGMHAWRHRLAVNAFDMSEGDYHVVKQLLGHVSTDWSKNYTKGEQAQRSAKLRAEIRGAKLAGKAKDLLIWAIGQDNIPDQLSYLQKALQSDDQSLMETVKTGARNLGFGLCLNPSCPKNSCESCGHYLALEEHVPALMSKLQGAWAILSVQIEEIYNGDVIRALENPKLRGQAYVVEDMRHHLRDLGVDDEEINVLLRGGD